jgi:hypothetical protein
MAVFRGTLQGQDTITGPAHLKLKSNAVHGSLGAMLFFYGPGISVAYEHALKRSVDRSKSLWLRAGGGWYMGVDGHAGYIVDGGLTAISGKGAYHVELYFGYMLNYNQDRYYLINAEREEGTPYRPRNEFVWFSPCGSVGFRYQKPGERLVVRTGAGYPSIVHLGFGFAF